MPKPQNFLPSKLTNFMVSPNGFSARQLACIMAVILKRYLYTAITEHKYS